MDGVSMQTALRDSEMVVERKITDIGPGDWYSLKLGDRIIPLGDNRDYADFLVFALRRNARAFDGVP